MIEQLDQKLSQLKSIRSGLLQIPPELKSELDLTKILHANHAIKSRVEKMLSLDESQRPARRQAQNLCGCASLSAGMSCAELRRMHSAFDCW